MTEHLSNRVARRGPRKAQRKTFVGTKKPQSWDSSEDFPDIEAPGCPITCANDGAYRLARKQKKGGKKKYKTSKRK